MIKYIFNWLIDELSMDFNLHYFVLVSILKSSQKEKNKGQHEKLMKRWKNDYGVYNNSSKFISIKLGYD